MKTGDVVTYLDAKGGRHKAEVEAVTGSGASGYKTLGLALAGGTQLADVPHENDHTPDEGFWRERAERAEAIPEPLPSVVAPVAPVKRRPKGKKT